jgi:GntR family transcriptional regulator, transcriptional repressor for pyruvate dehydrogenase complex
MARDIAAELPPRPKLSARVANELRAQLQAGAYPPGKKLPTENRLTERFGVSRTVIREALAVLAADGLVQARQGAGVFAIASPSAAFGAIGLDIGNRISTALNVLEVRMGIEIEAAGFAAERRSGSQEAFIHEAYMEFERLLALDEPTHEADFDIHRAIARATNNPFYVEVLDSLGSRTIPCNTTTPWVPRRCCRAPTRPACSASMRRSSTPFPARTRLARATPCASICTAARSATGPGCATVPAPPARALPPFRRTSHRTRS